MGLVDKLRSLVRGQPAYSGVIRFGGTTFAAQAWDFTRVANSVYGNPTGYRCVEAIAANMSRPGWVVTKGNDDLTGGILDVLNRPGPQTSGAMMRRDMARDLELTGKSFWIKMQGADGLGDTGPITGLRRMAPQRVTVIGNADDDLLGFVYTDRSGNRTAALPESVLYLRYPHPDRNYDGLPPAIVAGVAAETDNAAGRFNYDLLSNDSALPGYVSVEDLTADQFKEWKAIWESGEAPGKTRFLSGKASYSKVGMTNQELTYKDLRTASQHDMMRAFGCPPVVVFEMARETYANADAEKAMFWQQTILPKLTVLSDELSLQLGGPGEQIGYDLEDIEELSETRDAQIDRLCKLVENRVIVINEARDELELDPVEWGDVPTPGIKPLRAELGADNSEPIDASSPTAEGPKPATATVDAPGDTGKSLVAPKVVQDAVVSRIRRLAVENRTPETIRSKWWRPEWGDRPNLELTGDVDEMLEQVRVFFEEQT